MIAGVVALALALPAAASAWTVTVKIHGAGQVSETVNRFGDTRNQGSCAVGPSGRSETSPASDCVLGTASGFWNSGDVVRLAPSVPTEAYNRGWRYLKWVDGTGSGQINCDPQDTTGDQTTPNYCEFQIFANLYVDLYFEDVYGPQDTSIGSGPASPTKQTTASFSFNAQSDPDASFECRLDRPGQTGSYSTCGGSADKSEAYSGLTANGTYTFYVRGVDPSGNSDPTPASLSWTVDTVAPNPTISGGPSEGSFVSSTSASFTVGTSDGSLSCRIDGSPVGCGNPVDLVGLGDGAHAFAVEATDAAGNTASRTRNWTVDTVAPSPDISGGPAEGSLTASRSASFTVSSDEQGALECSLDGVAFSACSGTVEYAALADGAHDFRLRATDRAGNATTEERNWVIDTGPPETTIDSGPTLTGDNTPTFGFSSNESGAGFRCSLDGGPTVQCDAGSFTPTSSLGDGPHRFSVIATDAAGNEDPSAATRSFTVDTAAPMATITASPPPKLKLRRKKKVRVSFGFEAAEGASFSCKLDSGPAEPCSSPTGYRVGKGKHRFEVVATDGAGNAGPPEGYSFKVRKKKRR